MRLLRIGLAQINTTVGDIVGNRSKIARVIAAARDQGCGIVAFPELAVTGYPPEDLVLIRGFCAESRTAVESLGQECHGILAFVGFVDWADGQAHNAAAVIADGVWCDTYYKRRLPNYGVFDEERYFVAGRRTPVYQFGGMRVAVSICEDIWYPGEPVDAMALGGAELIININASPYHRGRISDRTRMLSTRAADNVVAVAYVNSVGGQDELVFDGGSLAFGPSGELIARAPQFLESLLVCDVDLDNVAQVRLRDARYRAERQRRGLADLVERVPLAYEARPVAGPTRGSVAELLESDEEVWRALVLGTRDYVTKTGFSSVVVGLSGGIDSSVVAAIAVDALGAPSVTGVYMPSRFSSEHSSQDAQELAANLGIGLVTIPIEPAHQAMIEMVRHVAGDGLGLAGENLQARQRGNVLMTLSNKFGWLVLTTGNKSEMATGYATLYGDMAGGFAVIKDVPKTLVYRLAAWRNRVAERAPIPQRTLTKAPSAELRPDQTDQDTLPPYEVLDAILELYVERDYPASDIIARGFDQAIVETVISMVDRNEYKRRQAPPGVRISTRAFGRDRRFPLATRRSWRQGVPT